MSIDSVSKKFRYQDSSDETFIENSENSLSSFRVGHKGCLDATLRIQKVLSKMWTQSTNWWIFLDDVQASMVHKKCCASVI